MKTITCIAALMLILFPALRACAGDTSAYILGPDDVIDISVPNFPDLNKVLTILPDGMIAFADAGDIRAAGKTPKALAADIQTALEKTRNRADVIVSVKEIHSQRVRITGAVKMANNYDLKRNWRLMDVVAVAGGLSAKPTRVTGHIVRGTKLISLNLVDAMAKPDSDANPLLEPDDMILLDEQDVVKQVNVMGEVAKQGPYDLDENLTVISLLSEAGSYTDKASLSKAYVLRSGKKIDMNLFPTLIQNKPDANVTDFKFQAGDTLFIPKIDANFAVLGQVMKPGPYPLSEGKPTTVLDALAQAGGQTPDADLKNATIGKMAEGKQVALRRVNIEDILKKGKMANNVALQPDEYLNIPNKSKKVIGAGDFIGPIFSLLTFGLLR